MYAADEVIAAYLSGKQVALDHGLREMERGLLELLQRKHAATIQLVNQRLPQIRTEYRKLHDTCMTAQYCRYQVQKAIAADARADPGLIEQACTAA